MAQLDRGLRLAQEAVAQVGLGVEAGAQHLDDAQLLELPVAHEVEHPHAALRQLAHDLVLALDLAEREHRAPTLLPGSGAGGPGPARRYGQVWKAPVSVTAGAETPSALVYFLVVLVKVSVTVISNSTLVTAAKKTQ